MFSIPFKKDLETINFNLLKNQLISRVILIGRGESLKCNAPLFLLERRLAPVMESWCWPNKPYRRIKKIGNLMRFWSNVTFD